MEPPFERIVMALRITSRGPSEPVVGDVTRRDDDTDPGRWAHLGADLQVRR
jgi:hypothetical protein